jgi:hypothetical protein
VQECDVLFRFGRVREITRVRVSSTLEEANRKDFVKLWLEHIKNYKMLLFEIISLIDHWEVYLTVSK